MSKTLSPTDDAVQEYVKYIPASLDGYHRDFSVMDYARVVWNMRNGASPERGVAMSRNSKRWEEIAEILVEHNVLEFDQYYIRWSLSASFERSLA